MPRTLHYCICDMTAACCFTTPRSLSLSLSLSLSRNGVLIVYKLWPHSRMSFIHDTVRSRVLRPHTPLERCFVSFNSLAAETDCFCLLPFDSETLWHAALWSASWALLISFVVSALSALYDEPVLAPSHWVHQHTHVFCLSLCAFDPFHSVFSA